jgi:hypothetical protein
VDLSTLLGQTVTGIRVDTAYFPPIQIVGQDLESTISTGPAGEPVFNAGAILRPKLTVDLVAGDPIVYAPYGDPGEGTWFPLIAGGALLFFIAYKLGERRGRRHV